MGGREYTTTDYLLGAVYLALNLKNNQVVQL